jgi:type IV pilus assembly protein PilY1
MFQSQNFKPLSRAIILSATSMLTIKVYAQPYPALPPSLSTSVTPNVMLHIDNSGSMNDKVGGVRKIETARNVGKALIAANPNLRWGVFAFDKNSGAKGGKLQAAIGSSKATLNTAIDGLGPDTNTPLGEAMLEITRYFAGETSYYGKIAGSYTSPIQYRCQKNFAIMITDGEPYADDEFPGTGGRALLNYTSYTAANVAETRVFGACKDTTNISSYLTCPSKLEGSTTANAFTSGGDYPRALRDVAMYAYDRDLKVGGLDGDGVSWDDPKFRKQNLQTYTVGFAINVPVLNAAAIVGKGKYYTASDNAALQTSLQNAVDDIIASTSNAGGVATQSETTQVGNKVFQPVFNPNGWYGELRCFNLDASAGLGTACTPNAKAVVPSATASGGRNIYTSKVITTASPTDNETTAFDFKVSAMASMTTNQKNLLGSTAAIQQNNINFIRGVEGISGFRSRYNATTASTNLMGDIVDGQPVVVTKPTGSTNDTAYAAFVTNNANRNFVFIGANDGMLHGFRINESTSGAGDNMSEVMGYIPSSVYSGLKALGATDYGTGTPHVYHVNGSLKQSDVKLGGTWRTLIVGGLGQGGQGYFAVDATNASSLSAATSAVKWEWNDAQSSSMGYSFGAPLIYNVRTSDTTVVPAVIVSNGYESDYDDTAVGGQKSSVKDSVLYILNADTGALIKSISVPSGGGLSSPAGLDVGQDGILDYVYAGDMNGKMWRFDLTSNSPADFKLVSTPIFYAGVGKPISLRPAVMPVYKGSDGSSVGNIILFGTGKLLTNSDRSDTTQQSLYGILDKMEDSPVTVPNTISATTLRDQTFVDTYTDSAANSTRDGTYRKVSANSIDLTSSTNTYLGWVIRLPISSERLVSTPLVFKDKVLFGTGVTVSSEQCLPGGTGWVIGLNPLTGSVVKKDSKINGAEYSFIDLNADGKSTVADKIPFSSGSSYISGYSKNGIPTEISYVSSSSNLSGPSDPFSSAYGDAGSVMALREANSQGVYTGNGGPGGVTGGRVIPRIESGGKGLACSGTVGNDNLECDKLLGAPSGAAGVTTTTWREIK